MSNFHCLVLYSADVQPMSQEACSQDFVERSREKRWSGESGVTKQWKKKKTERSE